MKLAYVTAGAAGMYCGSCLHDNTLARALIARGHDVALIPTYTPIRTDEADVSIDRVFYGAISVYLEQKSALFRHTPMGVDRLLNNRRLLDWLSRRASSTDAAELGALTLSMLRGEDGNQSKELHRLIDWLSEWRPEVVNLTNSMFLGLAGPIRRELGIPVLCSVQGEDLFLDSLREPFRSRVLEAMIDRARDVDGFIANSRYYIETMSSLLRVSPERMHLVPLGVSLEGIEKRPVKRQASPFTVGYLARISPEKGLHVLVEAFAALVERAGRDAVRLEIAGYLGPKDREYFTAIMEHVKSMGLDDVVRYRGEVDRWEKMEYLCELHALCVPTTYHEPKGLFVLEALACGTPVVEPRHGAFPEMIEATGGGVLVEPDSVEALAEALDELRCDPSRREALARFGRDAVHERFDDETMAESTLEVYRRYVERDEPRTQAADASA